MISSVPDAVIDEARAQCSVWSWLKLCKAADLRTIYAAEIVYLALMNTSQAEMDDAAAKLEGRAQ